MTYDSEVLADAPLGYWRLNEASGTVAHDSSGNARDLTINGSVGLGAAAIDAAESSSFAFPGTTSAYLRHDSDTWFPQASFTFEAWIVPSAVTGTGSSADVILSTDGTAKRGANLFIDSSKLCFASGSGNKYGNTVLANGSAYHAVCTFDSASATLQLYVNGALDGTFSTTVPVSTGYPLLAGVSFFGANSLNAPFNGRMADLAYYDHALSAARIQAHYAAGTTSPTPGGSLVGTTRVPSASVSGSFTAPTFTGTLAATTRRLRASLAGSTGSVDHSGHLQASSPRVTALLSGTFVGTVTTTVTENLFNGRERDGMAMVTVDPAVAAAPSTLQVSYGVDKAVALPVPTMDNGRPTGSFASARAVSTPAGRDRILVGGVDITYLRGKALAIPSYTLSEPFAYDSCTLTVPQVNPLFEQLGTGSLRWARKGSSVVFQRVYADGTKVTDYRGVVLAVRSSGGALTLDVGGEVSGRAQLLNAQPPLFWKTKDVGWLAWEALAHVGVTMTPRGGPNTGIRIPRSGGMSWVAWMQQVCAMSQTNTGAQRTMMPKTPGGQEWGFSFKDTTTVDCTIFLDGARAAEDLVDDASEQPNVWYGTGVTPDGIRIRNGRYPGIIAGPAPAYPMANGGSFGQGTTDADTVDGSGVRTLQFKLVWQNYLDDGNFTPSTYDAATAAAVKRLQRDAGLDVTGDVNQATWDALFDISATGYSLEGAKIFPLVEDNKVRPYNYTANGSIAGRNPKFDRRVLRVERNIDFGSGVTKPRMIDWCEGQDDRLDGPNWAGTITLNGIGAFRGKWNQGDTPTAADVLGMRDIRPGMNAWLPGFDGGTLVHISGATYNPGTPGSVTLAVDTQARDLMELAQVIERNRQSRRNIRREWNHENRSNGPNHNQITFDEYGGTLGHDRKLKGGTWNIVPIVMGQTGTVGRTVINCTQPAAEFCFAVLSRPVSEHHLQRRIGNPFPVDSSGQSVWETGQVLDWMDNKTILNAEGDELQPCGYGHRRKFGDKTDSNGNPIQTNAPLIGRLISDASFGYVTPSDTEPVVFLAIWPDRDCVLQSGRIFYKLEDDAV